VEGDRPRLNRALARRRGAPFSRKTMTAASWDDRVLVRPHAVTLGIGSVSSAYPEFQSLSLSET